jgi:predicted nucleic acid-binding protein
VQCVIDASALVELLIQGPRAREIEQAIGDSELIAPDILGPEALQSLRGLERTGTVATSRAEQAVRRLVESPIAFVPTRGLLHETWSLRHNVSAYDGCYVALARVLSCALLTADRSLARAPRLGVSVLAV